MSDVLLACKRLTIGYGAGPTVVQGIDLTIRAGECLALVGPSGSGKTTIARAILGLLPPGAQTSGSLTFQGQDVLTLDEAALRQLRGRAIGYVAQDPYQACDPLRTVQTHVSAAWAVHGERPAAGVVCERLAQAGIADAARAIDQYPHQWSGGMLQRASIAAATAHAPALLVADEPTSALDTDRADAVLATLKASGSAVLLISHDLGLVLRHADRIALCDEGRILETGTPQALSISSNRYVQNLFSAVGVPSRKGREHQGEICLSGRGLGMRYGGHDAISDCDVSVYAGEILGITGPSGCGKSTLLRLLGGLERPYAGTLKRSVALNRPGSIMPVFQDPVVSLNSRWAIWRSLTEPLTARHLPRLSQKQRRDRAAAALEQVGLGAVDPESLPGQLSSGQCQRISVARATIGQPAIILADEPTSALDTIARQQVLNLLSGAALDGTAIVLVSHDQHMLNQFADRVLVMQDGRLAVRGPFSQRAAVARPF
ncbi:MAG: ATP-binding cassette domain-containing protein [Alphaproteobacteria bacterium]|nr:ATP-binding cassette domain-containing protein [Alphaproteobacteria bacterium]